VRARVIHQNPAHRLGGDSKEMDAVLPFAASACQAQVCFVDQVGHAKRVSGPLAGFIVAVVALVVGLNLSTVVDRAATHGMQLGEPLLLQFIAWLVVGSLPPQADIVLHPIAFAAWNCVYRLRSPITPIFVRVSSASSTSGGSEISSTRCANLRFFI